MKAYSFPRGGILLEGSAVPSGLDSSSVAFLPATSVIPLSRHPGRALRPLVAEGDSVREGMPVGRDPGGGSAVAHASVPGRVAGVARWEDGEGRVCEGLLVRMEGSFDRLGAEGSDFLSELPGAGMGCAELAALLGECGVVEMEGSGAPVAPMAAAFGAARGPKALVARCVFDDPWLVADRVLCRERLEDVVDGCFAVAEACGAGRVIFAFSRADRRLGADMLAEASRRQIPSSLMLTGSRYPQRGRREMAIALRAFARRERLELGALLMLGPATLAAARDAVRRRLPVLERYVAVGGSAVRRPRVMRARIGKRIGDLFEECGGLSDGPLRVVSGSPFFGGRVRYLDEPVGKASYAFVAMAEPSPARRPDRGCISCGECRRVCPVGLDPEELFKAASAPGGGQAFSAAFFGGNGEGGLEGCQGCGCCELVCPSRLPLPAVILGGRHG